MFGQVMDMLVPETAGVVACVEFQPIHCILMAQMRVVESYVMMLFGVFSETPKSSFSAVKHIPRNTFILCRVGDMLVSEMVSSSMCSISTHSFHLNDPSEDC